MTYNKRLGVFVRVPEVGRVKTRLIPPLTPEQACDLYSAFLSDLFARLAKLKKVAGTVFFAGEGREQLRAIVPGRFELAPQRGATLGERMRNAFEVLLQGGGYAVLIGSDSPDIPLVYLKRAYLKLKHRDLVLGPAFDGGYYLIGLRRILPSLFDGIGWGTPAVLRQTLEKVRDHGIDCALLPPWYDVDDVGSLSILHSMLLARKIEKADRLHGTERVVDGLELDW